MIERIETVAMLLPSGEIWKTPRPGRHHTCFREYYEEHGKTMPCPVQGFMTSEERFVGREEAWTIAETAGQLIERAPTDGRGGTLYSEDVW